MQIKIKSKNLELTEALKEYTEHKLSRLEKFLDGSISAEVMLTTERNFHVIEVTIHANGFMLRGEEKMGDMYSSIDCVVDKLERQALKHKEKSKNHHYAKEEGARSSNHKGAMAVDLDVKKQRILSIKPEEAIAEMLEHRHLFYVFQNPESETINVIYRGENGRLTLLQPVV